MMDYARPGSLFGLGSSPNRNQLPDLSAARPAGPSAAFVYGQGGARLTPDEIAAQRGLAQRQMMAGMDTSPVGSWAQGAARVAQALVANITNRRLDRMSADNAAENRSIATLLLDGRATAGDAAGVVTNPYASPETRKLALAQYERLTPKPEGPSDLQQRVEYLNGFQPGLGGQYAQNYAANGGGTPQFVTIPGGGTFMVPRGGAAGASPAPAAVPDGAVSYLRGNPATADQFDAKYGAGASARYLHGGAAPQASTPFPTR